MKKQQELECHHHNTFRTRDENLNGELMCNIDLSFTETEAAPLLPSPRRLFFLLWFVCLSGFKQHCAKPTIPVSMKIGGRV